LDVIAFASGKESGLLVALYTAIGHLVDDQMWAVRR
jgi:hypothetical protein